MSDCGTMSSASIHTHRVVLAPRATRGGRGARASASRAGSYGRPIHGSGALFVMR